MNLIYWKNLPKLKFKTYILQIFNFLIKYYLFSFICSLEFFFVNLTIFYNNMVHTKIFKMLNILKFNYKFFNPILNLINYNCIYSKT